MPWRAVHPMIDGMKICIRCKEMKPITEFPRQEKNKEGVRSDCKQCNNEKNKVYYLKNREAITEKAREYNKTEHRRTYSRNYAKEWMRAKRDLKATRPRPFFCECCGDMGGNRGMVWDHNHGNGKFRGWLCNRCNRVLGMCGDNPVVLKLLARYLEKRGFLKCR